MADDQDKTNEDQDDDFGALTGGSNEDDEGFGTSSLPPLSDFDSQGSDSGDSSDSDLPPLDTPEGGEDDDDSFSGLPPIVDIKVDTPAVRPSDLDTPTPTKRGATPSKGRVTPPRTSGQATTPSPAGFTTPSDAGTPSDSGFGFQDFAADSDFSPETPEIGPGPDSDIETPMFDSAFGGDSDEFSTGVTSSAPTQAMQTPMFGDAGGDDAFGGASPEFGGEAGTPVPDFSPDTGAGLRDTSGATPPPVGAPRRRRSPVMGALLVVLALVAGLAVGTYIGPKVMDKGIPLITNPHAEQMAQDQQLIEQLKRRVDELGKITPGTTMSQAELDDLIRQVRDNQAELARLDQEKIRLSEEIALLENRLTLIRADIEEKNNEFVEAQEALEDLRNETAITRARHDGLLAENERLTGLVGELEVANARRQATKDTLLHNTELLIIQIQGGSPLTPERYAYDRRLARATELRDKVARAKWVDPQLLDEYTSLYLAELGIASSREYFYARIPVRDSLDNTMYRWAECLMNGNWSVYFRTIDGNIVGSYENVAGAGPPRYEFRQDVQSDLRQDIVAALESARPEDWKAKFDVLRQKDAVYNSKTALQRNYESLE